MSKFKKDIAKLKDKGFLSDNAFSQIDKDVERLKQEVEELKESNNSVVISPNEIVLNTFNYI